MGLAVLSQGPDEVIPRRCVESVCTGKKQDDVGRVLLQHLHDTRHGDQFHTKRVEYILGGWDRATVENAGVAESGKSVVIRIEQGIHDAILPKGGVVQAADEVKRDAFRTEQVLQWFAVASGFRIGQTAGSPVFLGEVGSTGDAVPERQDPQRFGGGGALCQRGNFGVKPNRSRSRHQHQEEDE